MRRLLQSLSADDVDAALLLAATKVLRSAQASDSSSSAVVRQLHRIPEALLVAVLQDSTPATVA